MRKESWTTQDDWPGATWAVAEAEVHGPGSHPGEQAMRFHTYTKFDARLADVVDLQGLLDQLADFLLQSGFAGGQSGYGGEAEDDADRSLEGLRSL